METTTAPPAGTPDQPPAQERPRLVRSRTDRKVAGVAGGIAQHLNIDPLLVRIVFVVLTLGGGVGILLYALGWLLVPQDGEDPVGGGAFDRMRHSTWIPIGLLVVGGSILFGNAFSWDGGAVFFALVLIALGWLLYKEESVAPASGSPGGAPGGGASFTTPAYGGVAPSTAVSRPAPASYLGRYTFAGMLLVIGFTALLETTDVITFDRRLYPALALSVVGGGLAVGAFWGRSRALIVLGVLLVPVVILASLVDVPLTGGAGERNFQPATATSVRDEYRLVAGEMVIDLTETEWGSEPVSFEATIGMGELSIIVPQGVEVDLDASVGAGEITFFDESREGFDVDLDSVGGSDSPTAELIVDARVSLGVINVIGSSQEVEESQ
ncbi:MAG: PspC domain-containing protein [Actinobacteria bacterium]|nr:PspC domain-containing protein [Actinomycetota bacterium]